MKAVVQLPAKPDVVFNAPFITTHVDGDGELAVTCYSDADPPDQSITELATYARDRWDNVRMFEFPAGGHDLDMWHERQSGKKWWRR